jgi:hypothetical protein
MRATVKYQAFRLAAALLLTAVAATQLRAEEASAPPFEELWKEVPTVMPATSLPQIAKAKIQNTLPVKLGQALYLIRSTLLTLNDANRSGNYSVLRDLAAPSFQAKNSAADLAQIFSNLRGRRFDLFAVAISAPKLTAPPHIENGGLLRLTGYFPTRPLQIDFDLLFQDVGNEWRLFGISVATPKTSLAEVKKPARTKPNK